MKHCFQIIVLLFFLREYNGLKNEISNMEMGGIGKLTGCTKPCHYREGILKILIWHASALGVVVF